MAYSHIAGHKFHYILTPRKDPSKEHTSGDHPCYVLIHGLFFGNLSAWYPRFTSELSFRGDVLCYDLRGHGLSEVSSHGYTLEHQVSDLVFLITELGWESRSICFIGHSFGARIALSIATQRRLKEKSLRDQVILIDPPLKQGGDDLDHLLQHLNEQGIEALKTALPSSLLTLLSSEGRRFRKLLRRWERLIAQTTFCNDIELLPNITKDEITQLSRSGATLFGEDSGCISGRSLIEGALPTHRIEILKGGGHFLLNQDPDFVLEFVLRHSMW